MIQGKEKQFFTADDIMFLTGGGYDIYIYYLGEVSRIMQRPWGKKEKKLSWGIFRRENVWFWKDQATEESGTAIHFVQKKFSLSFKEAINKIVDDLSLKNPEQRKVYVRPLQEEAEIVKIKFTDKPFEDRHHKFWHPVTEDICKSYNCFAVKDAAINGKRVAINKDELVFAYHAPEEDGVKLYFPERERTERFRNNVSYHYLWNFSNISKCEKLIIQKSVKDMIFTSLVTPCVIATQAEGIKIFNEDVVNKINSITDSPWIWYGSDWDGVQKCKRITDTNNWKYINTPKDLLPEINDVYGYVKKFGIKSLEDFMKLKKLL